MMKLIDKMIELAEGEVGVIEDSGYNNCGARIREYQKATWLQPEAWPWCAAFTCWLLKEALRDEAVLAEIRDTVAKDFDSETWRCKDASAFGWVKWAKSKGLYVTDESELAKRGDLVIFDFSHIGIVVEDQDKFSLRIKTIEGNTNGSGDRDSESGDGVWRKSRPVHLVKNYVRLG